MQSGKWGGVATDWLLSDYEDAWRNEGHFLYTNHHADRYRRVRRSILEKCRNACVRMKYGHGSMAGDHIYTDFFADLIIFRNYKLMMYLWTFWAIFVYGGKIVLEKLSIKLRILKNHKILK